MLTFNYVAIPCVLSILKGEDVYTAVASAFREFNPHLEFSKDLRNHTLKQVGIYAAKQLGGCREGTEQAIV